MLKPSEYFARYGQHLSEGVKAESAWIETERDFFIAYGFRRFLTYESFRDAHAKFRRGHKFRRVVIHFCETFAV